MNYLIYKIEILDVINIYSHFCLFFFFFLKKLCRNQLNSFISYIRLKFFKVLISETIIFSIQ